MQGFTNNNKEPHQCPMMSTLSWRGYTVELTVGMVFEGAQTCMLDIIYQHTNLPDVLGSMLSLLSRESRSKIKYLTARHLGPGFRREIVSHEEFISTIAPSLMRLFLVSMEKVNFLHLSNEIECKVPYLQKNNLF